MRFFNTAGPCNSEDHFMVPVEARLDFPTVMRLIRQKSYFVLHAPRQTGKTTTMLALAEQLNATGDYISIMLSMEMGAPFSQNPGEAERAILSGWRVAIPFYLPSEYHPPVWVPDVESGSLLTTFLSGWASAVPKPLVLFFDEVDALEDASLISVLRQLRTGYNWRPRGFPSSVAMIGLRDVRDYKLKSGGRDRLRSASPFNIAVRSFLLRNFSQPEVADLLSQHSAESGQAFEPAAIDEIFRLSEGQPWLVNSLARVAVEELQPDAAHPIDLETINRARETVIQRRQTHLDSLTDKLNEARVQSVIEPIIAGRSMEHIPLDDREYVLDLGLIRRLPDHSLMLGNEIYEEIITRVLASSPQDSIPSISPTWLNEDGSLNEKALLDAFLAFWRQHGQPLLSSAPYHEIAPHLVLMAFLHRVVNGEGRIEREYAVGSGRIDLCLHYRKQRLAMELKVWRDGEKDPLAKGLAQIDSYLTGLGLETGWLVIFDRRAGLPRIEDRTTVSPVTTPAGRSIVLIRG